jgi:DNA-binding transcriptional regulator YdaS (Cro superfamily)
MNFKTWIGISGLQQKKVAEHLKLSPSYLSEIATGKKKATPVIAHLIEQYTKGEVKRHEMLLTQNHKIDNETEFSNLLLDRGSPLTPELITKILCESGYANEINKASKGL